jgi:hypothetical protein
MSRKTDRQAAERKAEDAATRVLLAEVEARFEAREQHDRQRAQQLLAAERSELAHERLEAQAEALATYRATVVAQVQSSKQVAPQFLEFIDGTSREAIDNAAHLAALKTAEIMAEVAGQRQGSEQPRDEQGRFAQQQPIGERGLPAGLTADEMAKVEAGTYSLEDHARMRDRVGLGHRDAGLFN